MADEQEPRLGAYEKYGLLNKRLIELVARDQDDSAEGWALREEMDPLWERMTDEERELTEQDSNALLAAAEMRLQDVDQE